MDAFDTFAKWAVIFCFWAAVAICAATGGYVMLSGACIAKPGQTVNCPE